MIFDGADPLMCNAPRSRTDCCLTDSRRCWKNETAVIVAANDTSTTKPFPFVSAAGAYSYIPWVTSKGDGLARNVALTIAILDRPTVCRQAA
jgi:hypothetical protein